MFAPTSQRDISRTFVITCVCVCGWLRFRKFHREFYCVCRFSRQCGSVYVRSVVHICIMNQFINFFYKLPWPVLVSARAVIVSRIIVCNRNVCGELTCSRCVVLLYIFCGVIVVVVCRWCVCALAIVLSTDRISANYIDIFASRCKRS